MLEVHDIIIPTYDKLLPEIFHDVTNYHDIYTMCPADL